MIFIFSDGGRKVVIIIIKKNTVNFEEGMYSFLGGGGGRTGGRKGYIPSFILTARLIVILLEICIRKGSYSTEIKVFL
jgi:hypothetical protein